MTYNSIVEKLKIIARDGLRMGMTSRVQTKVAEVEKHISSHEENVMNLRKDIARCDFAGTQLVEADPDFAEKKKELEKEVETINKEIEEENKLITELKTEKEELEKKITSIENGEVKVSIDDLNARVAELINEVTAAAAVKAASTPDNN